MSSPPVGQVEFDPGNDHAELGVLYDLIEARQWNAVHQYFQASPEIARSGRLSAASTHCNLPLHEVCAQQPPLAVIDLLLQQHPEAIETQGQYGYLPLHIACSSGANYDIVARLIEIYPAATRCRDDLDEALPLHLAARVGASEEVLMEILTTYPEGSFIRDASGQTPLDHAKQLPESQARNYAITALETAPILVSTARAASRRVEQELEGRIRGMREAHTEFVRQLEDRQDEEKTEFLQMEVQFHNELAEEKERNIELAEVILDAQKRERILTVEREQERRRLEGERDSYHTQLDQQTNDLQSLLKTADSSPTKDVNEKPLSVVEQVSALKELHHQTETELAKTIDDLKYNQDMVHHLGQLLSNKDKEINTLQKQLEDTEQAHQKATLRCQQLTDLHEGAQKGLGVAKKEIHRLQERTAAQQQQIQEANRIKHVQDSRVGSIKSLVSSLSYNIESWGVDEAQEVGWDKTSVKRTTAGPPPTLLEGMDNLKNVSGITETSSHPIDEQQADGTKLLIPPSPERIYSDKSTGETHDTELSTKLHEDEEISTLSQYASPARPLLDRGATHRPAA